jgi:hypothetical protein
MGAVLYVEFMPLFAFCFSEYKMYKTMSKVETSRNTALNFLVYKVLYMLDHKINKE